MHPFYGQSTSNNGIIEYRSLIDSVLNNELGKPTLLIHSNNQNIVYLETPFYLKDGHGATSVLQSKNLNRLNAQFIKTVIRKVISQKYSYNAKATKVELKKTKVLLPCVNGKISYEFMEKFVDIINKEQLHKLSVVMPTYGLHKTLTEEEKNALDNLNYIEHANFNLKDLYGYATRGKRLKSTDRKEGDLPFVTAGETNMGISGWISNTVDIYSENTITIDMFGSAKYRSYKYGADDHIAVIHTEDVDKFAVIYLTAAIHKSSHAGQFDYSRNFYASDADELCIQLPIKADKSPDYEYMTALISGLQKLIVSNIESYISNQLFEM